MEVPAASQQQQRKSCRIVTQYGDMIVVWESAPGHLSPAAGGSPRNSGQQQQQQQAHHKTQTRPVILTFHDLGLNSELQFATFCQHKDVRLMLQTFTMIHVNFVGQEPDGARLEAGFKYPSCQQLAECIVDVCAHLRIRSFIGLAVGAGAHIVGLLALMRPDLVDGLFLINPVMTSCSISEWLYFKMSAISSAGSQHNSPQSASPVSARGFRLGLLNHKHQQPTSPSPSSPRNQACEPEAAAAPASSPADGGGRAGGSRLRRLILSRNFLSGGGGGGPQAAAATAAEQPEASSKHRAVERCNSASSSDSQRSLGGARPGSAGTRRPPYEYLMYHHFGAGKFQRYRLSDEQHQHPDGSSPAHSDRCSAASTTHDQLTRTNSQTGTGRRPSSSGSLSLSPKYLDGLGSRTLRQWHIQAAYRRYFGQLNAHNLWLFAHAFAGRHSLNLRKDCGAAAHAAAAAATLGTSICSVFVGAAPGALSLGAAAPLVGHQPQPSQQSPPQAGNHNKKPPPQQDRLARGLVAGTKVKRTFTCQTLVMCSSVALHRERAAKLMSLLNPIQATCIQTDQLLVLEERPEKVCQALRLFLQGIGYSMSTYERRLRLGSAAAGSSAESAGSAAAAAPSSHARPTLVGDADTC